MDLGNVADVMRDLGENIVVERVATNEVAKCSEGGELFFDVVFDEEDVGCVQCAENGGDVRKQDNEMMPACPLSLLMVARLSAPMLLIMA